MHALRMEHFARVLLPVGMRPSTKGEPTKLNNLSIVNNPSSVGMELMPLVVLVGKKNSRLLSSPISLGRGSVMGASRNISRLLKRPISEGIAPCMPGMAESARTLRDASNPISDGRLEVNASVTARRRALLL